MNHRNLLVPSVDTATISQVDMRACGALLEHMVESNARWLRVNGNLYVVEEFQIATQCGGTQLRLTPVNMDAAYSIVKYRDDVTGEVRRLFTPMGSSKMRIIPELNDRSIQEYTETQVADSPPLDGWNRHMIHVALAAINQEDLDVMLHLFTSAAKEWEQRAEDTSPYGEEVHVYYTGAYCDPVRNFTASQLPPSLTVGLNCAINEDVIPRHPDVQLGTRWRTASVPVLPSTVAAVLAVHVSNHAKYDNREGVECDCCEGSGYYYDERYDEEYDEWVEYEADCPECEGEGNHERSDDDGYTVWSERYDPTVGYEFQSEHRLGTGFERYTRLTWGDACVDSTEVGSITSYLCNWSFDWETQDHRTTDADEFIYHTLDGLLDHMLSSVASSYSLTSNMGDAYSKTDVAMELIAANVEFFEDAGFTVLIPEGEATNPNEGYHYIHSVILARNPRVPTHRCGLIDFDDPCMIQGKLDLQEVA